MNCVCGSRADTPIVVHWIDGDRTYWYCVDCAIDVAVFVDGTELTPGVMPVPEEEA